jgi:uncharacterized protein YukE
MNIPSDTKPILTAIEQISESLSEINASRIQINETLKALQDKYKIPAKTFRRIALMYHRSNAAQIQNETSELNELYKKITSA